MRTPVVLPVADELVRRIGWLIILRWTAIAGAVCAVEVAGRLLSVPFESGRLYTLLAFLALYNTAVSAIARRMRVRAGSLAWARPSALNRFLVPRTFWGLELEPDVFQAATFAAAQMIIDIVFLSSLLHFSGGIENPFVFFSVFHVIIASILLSRRATYFQATLGLVLISVVALGECFGLLKHYSLEAYWRPEAYRNPLWVSGNLAVLGLTLYLSAYMCSTIAVRLRRRQRDGVLLSRELAQKAEALEKAYGAASEAERVKSEYMRKVAHELRGPLGTIQTALKVVLQGLTGDLPEKSRDLIHRAERRTEEMIAVSADLLALSRAKEAGVYPQMSAVDPVKVVRDVIDEIGPRAESAGVSLSPELESDIGTLKADAVGFQQLVGNLVNNAIRYTPKGGTVSVRMGKIGEMFRLAVEDTGIGIPEEDIPKIFTEFYRSANARQHAPEGTGLGLAIVNAVAEQHKGTVLVKSTEGRGTLVTVVLPPTQDANREPDEG